MRQIRLDRPHKTYETTNGLLVRYKASLGYQKTLEHYADKLQEGWQFESNWSPHPRARELDLDSLDRRVGDLLKTREVYVGEVAFDSNGQVKEKGRAIFTKPRVIELSER